MLNGGVVMKCFMDGIVIALKRVNQEKSHLNEIYRVLDSYSGKSDGYCESEVFNSR